VPVPGQESDRSWCVKGIDFLYNFLLDSRTVLAMCYFVFVFHFIKRFICLLH
jgi:hypothetical protein